MNKVLKSALADTPLVQNLNNSEYIEIILNGCQNLEERFSQIDAHGSEVRDSEDMRRRTEIS